MNGVHDMGGMHGFGSVDPDDDEPFHEEWEKRLFELERILGVHGLCILDKRRHLIEQLPPAVYLAAGYWERRFLRTERMLVDLGILEPGEIDERMGELDQVATGTDGSDPGLADQVSEALSSNSTFERDPKPPQFEVGDAVVARNIHPEGHTRLPRYVRRSRGEVTEFHGTQMLPDAAARGDTDVGEPLYTVRFESSELWGDEHAGSDAVTLHLFEPYLRDPSA